MSCDHAPEAKKRASARAFATKSMRRAITMAKEQKVTEYQERVYAALQQIPEGRITTYAALSKALSSSPRAVGGALRVNPFAPEIPCHRCIASTGVRRFFQDHTMKVLTRAVCGRLQGRLGGCAKWAEPDVKAAVVEGRRCFL
jgi:O-6-methylguanine DNA methyltransferase